MAYPSQDDIEKRTPYNPKVLYLDIETAPQTGLMKNEVLKDLWDEKMTKMRETDPDKYPESMSEEDYAQEAGLYAEFGQIVCISFGTFYTSKTTKELRFCVTSVYGSNEKELLQNFASMLTKKSELKEPKIKYFCGHNAKEFDIPYIIRRMLIHKISLPAVLQILDKKPWESPIIDTMELWKCGSYKYATKLKVLCAVFGIPTPKDDIDGSEVARVFHQEKNYRRIQTYCEKDVIATMQVHLNLLGERSLDPSKITHAPQEPCLLSGEEEMKFND